MGLKIKIFLVVLMTFQQKTNGPNLPQEFTSFESTKIYTPKFCTY